MNELALFRRRWRGAFLEATCSDGGQSAPLKSNPIPQAYCSTDKMTAYSRLSRFGMIYALLTDDHGAELLTWYLEASRARTSARREKEQASMAPGLASGGKCTELSMKYDLNSHSWKTHLCLWEEDLPESSVTLPKSGTMRNGLCWERTTWEPRTSGNASGYLRRLQQRKVSTAGANSRQAPRSRGMWPTPRAGKSSSENPESWLTRYAVGKVSTPPLGLAVKLQPRKPGTSGWGRQPDGTIQPEAGT